MNGKILSVMLAVFMVAGVAAAGSKADALGENLVRQFWADMKSENIDALKDAMDEGFQSIHQDGPRTKEEELALIKNLHLGEYTLSNFKTTVCGDAIIVTYTVQVTRETIDGKKMPTSPAQRMTVFLKSGDSYKLIAHANLESLK